MVPWPTRIVNPNGISIGSAIFAQLIAECPYTLQLAASSPLKIALPVVGYRPPFNTWFLGPTHVLSQTAFDQLSRFCRAHYCDRPTDKRTDRPRYSVGNNKPIYVRSTAMWPNNTDDAAVIMVRPLREFTGFI